MFKANFAAGMNGAPAFIAHFPSVQDNYLAFGSIEIVFDVMPNEKKMLTETVPDYTTNSATVCTRSEPRTREDYF